ncbi:homoserine O-succinyltransferase [Bacillus sp. JCM 19046]|uniref:Homoserine O-acetyltransferase n=1 Tax=Shouchella xiaoxiensis TaxID=766895 RepID=A0ABS2SZ29_9BACI|nr:homoserine O-succinyltransferase [Shouchella xiaoxiensis]MBM7840786.1 homoserine O-succinyltransferase [Shouchella xiaoxiensis]GAF13892.1 homoserine O-succinyltransferase [Bacillus sp. JCM 19045]GAF19769.1 homoserine O-succinyltransferase [Bacillus sp. JCM 19046]
MPIKIPDHLPAKEKLLKEKIFVMDESRAYTQDIRPLKICILNLMPTKQETETQLIRLLGNTPLQVDVSLLHPSTHQPKNTSKEHLNLFYKTIDEVKQMKFDGMIITGAPIETLPFHNVTYWNEMTSILDWTTTNVTSTLHICWGAQAGLFHHYDVKKQPLTSKLFGIYTHTVDVPNVNLLRGFDDYFLAPHSRHTTVAREDIEQIPDLEILSSSEEAGVYIASSKDGKRVFVMGHSEYDAHTLKLEYERDQKQGLACDVPFNYFPEGDTEAMPPLQWRAHSNLLFSNWLNYYVYQETPFHLHDY